MLLDADDTFDDLAYYGFDGQYSTAAQLCSARDRTSRSVDSCTAITSLQAVPAVRPEGTCPAIEADFNIVGGDGRFAVVNDIGNLLYTYLSPYNNHDMYDIRFSADVDQATRFNFDTTGIFYSDPIEVGLDRISFMFDSWKIASVAGLNGFGFAELLLSSTRLLGSLTPINDEFGTGLSSFSSISVKTDCSISFEASIGLLPFSGDIDAEFDYPQLVSNGLVWLAGNARYPGQNHKTPFTLVPARPMCPIAQDVFFNIVVVDDDTPTETSLETPTESELFTKRSLRRQAVDLISLYLYVDSTTTDYNDENGTTIYSTLRTTIGQNSTDGLAAFSFDASTHRLSLADGSLSIIADLYGDSPVAITADGSGSTLQDVYATVYPNCTLKLGSAHQDKAIRAFECATGLKLSTPPSDDETCRPVILSLAPAATSVVQTTVTPGPTQTLTMSAPTMTATPYSTPAPITALNLQYKGCVGSASNFTTFAVEDEDDLMTIELCQSVCSKHRFVALHDRSCYCADSIDNSTSTAVTVDSACNIPCPGNMSEACGGDYQAQANITSRRRQVVAVTDLLSLYENIVTPVTLPETPGSVTPPSGSGGPGQIGSGLPGPAAGLPGAGVPEGGLLGPLSCPLALLDPMSSDVSAPDVHIDILISKSL